MVKGGKENRKWVQHFLGRDSILANNILYLYSKYKPNIPLIYVGSVSTHL